ncbi:phosphate ABC transporter permease PstA [Methanolobus bombayensis]|uniref:phosphate ABC transporter permease PstA n=1 Tax=Methanolobus bombayensis TaxID=38023 RepID=UPI001FD78420|nr:phosphate ABC transporter permease PstA [Methanolobus bombayensis]MBP1909147.1 phosphate transport system permease protein [Methanolobus bombayensis]
MSFKLTECMMSKKKFNSRNVTCMIFEGISYVAATITVLILILIIGKIAIEAIPSLTPYFLLTPESKTKGFGGGIANAVVGTFLIATISTMLATPFAVGTAIYLKKYSKDGFLVRSFSFMIDVLAGTPSIVLGIFGLMFLVFYTGFFTGGFSLMTGSIALSILILPVIERAAEEALDTVPSDIEEASYALGANKWETISKVTIPYALSGIITGIILSAGRAAGESAVVILTAGYSQFLPEFKVASSEKLVFGIKVYPFQDLVGTLPINIYHAYQFPNLVSPSEGFAAAFVLIVIVMVINVVTRLIVWRHRIG